MFKYAPEKIIEAIKDIRNSNNLTITAFANSIKVSPATVRRWEKGISIPTLDSILDICNIYSINVENFVISL